MNKFILYTVKDWKKKYYFDREHLGFDVKSISNFEINSDLVICDICNKDIRQPKDNPKKKVVFDFPGNEKEEGIAVCEDCSKNQEKFEKSQKLFKSYKDVMSNHNDFFDLDMMEKMLKPSFEDGLIKFNDGMTYEEFKKLPKDKRGKECIMLTEKGKKFLDEYDKKKGFEKIKRDETTFGSLVKQRIEGEEIDKSSVELKDMTINKFKKIMKKEKKFESLLKEEITNEFEDKELVNIMSDFVTEELFDGLSNKTYVFEDSKMTVEKWTKLSDEEKEKFPIGLSEKAKKENLPNVINLIRNGNMSKVLIEDVIMKDRDIKIVLTKIGQRVRKYYDKTGKNFSDVLSIHIKRGLNRQFSGFIMIEKGEKLIKGRVRINGT